MNVIDDLVRAAQREPRNPLAFARLARACAAERQWSRAVEVFGEAFRLGLAPTPAHLFEFAGALTQHGEVDKAEALIRAVLVDSPHDPEALLQLGPILSAKGDFDAAVEVFHRVIKARPDLPAAWEQLCFAKRFSSTHDPDIGRMRDRLNANDCPAPLRETLCFALAKALDECAQYDEAFVYAARGNRLQRDRQGGFDQHAYTKLIDATILAFSAPRLARLCQTGNPSSRPIFIVGLPRSGTTLLEQMLSSHADIAGAGEIPFMSYAAQQTIRPFPSGLDALTPAIQRRLCADYLHLHRRFEDAACVTDKFPGNLLYAGFIHALFPNATVVMVTRGLADSCVSMFFQHFRRHNEFATDLGDIALVHAQSARLVAHWLEALADRVLCVSYEQLVENPEPQLRAVLERCALAWDPDCLCPADNRRPVLTLSSRQVREPVYRSSVGRWQHYRQHLGELPCGDGAAGGPDSRGPASG